jgi:hypothetical protein
LPFAPAPLRAAAKSRLKGEAGPPRSLAAFRPLPVDDPSIRNSFSRDRGYAGGALRREVSSMPGCHEMKLGQVWRCDGCGLELQVVRECKDAGTPDEQCTCHYEHEPCTFSCCGKELTLKQ